MVIDPTAFVKDYPFDQVRKGRNAGNAGLWTGRGITSSSAAAGTGLTGLAVVGNDGGNETPLVEQMDGVILSTDSVLVLYTLVGDSDVDVVRVGVNWKLNW